MQSVEGLSAFKTFTGVSQRFHMEPPNIKLRLEEDHQRRTRTNYIIQRGKDDPDPEVPFPLPPVEIKRFSKNLLYMWNN